MIDASIRKRDEIPREDRRGETDTLLASRLMIGRGIMMAKERERERDSRGERSMADVPGN